MLVALSTQIRRDLFDGAGPDGYLVLEVGRPQDGSVRRYVIPQEINQLLSCFDRPIDVSDVATTYAKLGYTALTAEQIERIVFDWLAPMNIIELVTDRPGASKPPTSKAPAYLHLKGRLLPRRAVVPVARTLSVLFSPSMMVCSTVGVVALHLILYYAWWPNPLTHARIALRQTGGSAIGLALVVAIVHEFGHAAAAYRCGCRHVEIGIGQYLHMTVLYTDLSEAWRLPRRQRILIDLGGLYLQTVLLCTLVVLARVLGHWHAPSALFVLNDIMVIVTLNPFLRMDGYWVCADLIGVPNLRAESIAELQRLWRALIGIPREPSLRKLSWQRWQRVAVRIYSVFVVILFTYAAYLVVTVVVPTLYMRYPSAAAEVWRSLFDPRATWLHTGMLLARLLMTTAAVYGLGMFVYRLILRRAASWLLQWSRGLSSGVGRSHDLLSVTSPRSD